jgi:peroxiredoxin
MNQSLAGQPAPSFRLPSAQGGETGPEDFRGRQVILFFAKGMACGFCRQKMSQLARGLPRFHELDADILQIAPTPLDRARFYARNFKLPFPYLCDPDYRAYGAYGLGTRPMALAARAKALVAGMTTRTPENDWGEIRPALSEFSRLTNDDDLGFFIVDRGGVIRYARAGSYVLMEAGKVVGMRPIPSNEEILLELKRADGTTA